MDELCLLVSILQGDGSTGGDPEVTGRCVEDMIHEEKLNQLCLFILQKYGLSRDDNSLQMCKNMLQRYQGKKLLCADIGDKWI